MSVTDNRLQGRVVWYRWEGAGLSLSWLLLWKTMYILSGVRDRLESYVFEPLNGNKQDLCGKWQFVVSGEPASSTILSCSQTKSMPLP